MDTKFDFGPETTDRIVYVRPVKSVELPDFIRNQIGDVETLYAVHSEQGERLALVRDRRMAFVLARQHDFRPVTVH